jgi:hypothetical protein
MLKSVHDHCVALSLTCDVNNIWSDGDCDLVDEVITRVRCHRDAQHQYGGDTKNEKSAQFIENSFTHFSSPFNVFE